MRGFSSRTSRTCWELPGPEHLASFDHFTFGRLDAVAELIASGRLIDLILLAVAAEILLLYLWLPRSGSSLRLGELLPNLIAGAALLAALRLALTNAPWAMIAVALTAALLAHLVDLFRRWRRGRVGRLVVNEGKEAGD